MLTPPFWQWSACDLAAAIASKEISAREVIEAHIERADAVNPTLNAIVEPSFDAARAQAHALDDHIVKHGPVGPLHGVPVTIKINVDQIGTANSNGVKAFSSIIAQEDAPVVENLRGAGAVFLGRTNTPEFSFRLTTINELYGATLNPWDHDLSPGGSSGGASSSALAGMAPINHGNDIGGSLRFPAACCGLSTIKSGLGRVPAYNPSQKVERPPLAQQMSVQGAITREVCDTRLATKIMAGRDVRDPNWVPVPFEGPALAKPLKVAFTKDHLGFGMDATVAAALDQAAKMLSAAGYEVEEIDPPMVQEIAVEWMRNTHGEMAIMLGDTIREHGSPVIRKVIGDFQTMYGINQGDDLIHAYADRSRMIRAWNLFLEEYPLVLTPFLLTPPFKLHDDETTEGLHEIFRACAYSYAMNYLALPAATIPVTMADGLPVSVQIVGQRFREDLCLDAAAVIEHEAGVMAKRYWAREGLA